MCTDITPEHNFIFCTIIICLEFISHFPNKHNTYLNETDMCFQRMILSEKSFFLVHFFVQGRRQATQSQLIQIYSVGRRLRHTIEHRTEPVSH